METNTFVSLHVLRCFTEESASLASLVNSWRKLITKCHGGNLNIYSPRHLTNWYQKEWVGNIELFSNIAIVGCIYVKISLGYIFLMCIMIGGDMVCWSNLQHLRCSSYHMLDLSNSNLSSKTKPHLFPMDAAWFWHVGMTFTQNSLNYDPAFLGKASCCCIHRGRNHAGINMGVSKNRGTPKWMVYHGKPY